MTQKEELAKLKEQVEGLSVVVNDLINVKPVIGKQEEKPTTFDPYKPISPDEYFRQGQKKPMIFGPIAVNEDGSPTDPNWKYNVTKKQWHYIVNGEIRKMVTEDGQLIEGLDQIID